MLKFGKPLPLHVLQEKQNFNIDVIYKESTYEFVVPTAYLEGNAWTRSRKSRNLDH